MIGSASVAVKLSPVLVSLVESVVWVRILIDVPSTRVTDCGFGDNGESVFAGEVVSGDADGVKPVTVDESELLLHPASDSAMAIARPAFLNLVFM